MVCPRKRKKHQGCSLDTLVIFLRFFLQDLLYGVKFVFYTFFGFVQCFYVFKFLCMSLPSHELSLVRLYMYVTSLIRRQSCLIARRNRKTAYIVSTVCSSPQSWEIFSEGMLQLRRIIPLAHECCSWRELLSNCL